MSTVATQNFQSVNRTLEQKEPEVQSFIEQLGGPEAARVFLRHHVGEQNRLYFALWEYAQIVLGGAVLMFLVFGSHERKRIIVITGVMLALVLLMRFSVTPSITALSRELDFLPAAADSPIRNQFRAWHTAYAAIEMLKLALGLLVSAMLVASHHSSRRRQKHDVEIEYVKPANYPSERTPRERSASSIKAASSSREI